MKSLRLIVPGIILGAIIGILTFKSFTSTKTVEHSDVVIERIKAVKKIIVTEGYFSEVYSYKEDDDFYEMFNLNKQALLIVKGKAQVNYDLEKIDYKVDKDAKTITLINVPAPEISIDPSIKYYDIQENIFNSFSPEEHNKMNASAIKKLRQEVDKSDLKKMARRQLEASLNDVQLIGKELGWKIVWPKT